MCGCKNGKNFKVAIKQVNKKMQQITDSSEFIEIQYYGPNYTHLVGSPSGILRQYGLLNYGIHRRGDIFKVHALDLEKDKGQKFVPVSAPSQVQNVEVAQNALFKKEDIVKTEKEDTVETQRLVLEQEKPKRKRSRLNNN